MNTARRSARGGHRWPLPSITRTKRRGTLKASAMSTVTRYIAEFEMPTVPSGPIAGWVVDFNVSLFVGTVGRLGGEGIDRHTGVWATITEVQQPPGQRF